MMKVFDSIKTRETSKLVGKLINDNYERKEEEKEMENKTINMVEYKDFKISVGQRFNSRNGQLLVIEIYNAQDNVMIDFKYTDNSGGGRYKLIDFIDLISNYEMRISVKVKGKKFEEVLEVIGPLYSHYFIDTDTYIKLLNECLESYTTQDIVGMFKIYLYSDENIYLYLAEHLLNRYRNGEREIFEAGSIERLLDTIFECKSRDEYDEISEILKEMK